MSAIRPYRDDDLARLLDVWEAATSLAHPFLSAEFIARERVNIPELYIPLAETFVVEHDGRLAGFLALIGDEVGALFVDPALHGRGLGRALMDHARSLRSRLEVDVFEANSLGRKFYDRYGFLPLRQHVHPATGQPVLRLVLAPG